MVPLRFCSTVPLAGGRSWRGGKRTESEGNGVSFAGAPRRCWGQAEAEAPSTGLRIGWVQGQALAGRRGRSCSPAPQSMTSHATRRPS
jgi:hypothetical protein